jgi:hypothetical protein
VKKGKRSVRDELEKGSLMADLGMSDLRIRSCKEVKDNQFSGTADEQD